MWNTRARLSECTGIASSEIRGLEVGQGCQALVTDVKKLISEYTCFYGSELVCTSVNMSWTNHVKSGGMGKGTVRSVLFEIFRLTQRPEFNEEEREAGRIGLKYLDVLNIVDEALTFFRRSPFAWGGSADRERPEDYMLARLAALALLSPNTSLSIGPVRAERYVGTPDLAFERQNFLLNASSTLFANIRRDGEDFASQLLRANTLFHLLKENSLQEEFVTSLVIPEGLQREPARRRMDTRFSVMIKMSLSDETRSKLDGILSQSRIDPANFDIARSLMGQGVVITN